MRVTVGDMEMRWCAECRDEKAFEMPLCEDGHGADCLDLLCVECGFAIVTGRHEDAVVARELAAA